MKIVFIGAGNLATHLSTALVAAGQEVVQVYSRTVAHASEMAKLLDCPYTNDLTKVRQDADIYVFSVKDDVIGSLVLSLCQHIHHALFIHTAGSVPMDVFTGTTDHYGVLYPMQTFSKHRPVDFRQIPCFIEASDDQSLETIRSLAALISDHVTIADSEKRKKLHLAAVLCCNLANHCYRLAEQVLEQEGIDFSFYLPLIEETAQKVKTMSPRQAQTGPMVRYDVGIMQMQQNMLSNARTREIYRLMAESIHEDAISHQ